VRWQKYRTLDIIKPKLRKHTFTFYLNGKTANIKLEKVVFDLIFTFAKAKKILIFAFLS